MISFSRRRRLLRHQRRRRRLRRRLGMAPATMGSGSRTVLERGLWKEFFTLNVESVGSGK